MKGPCFVDTLLKCFYDGAPLQNREREREIVMGTEADYEKWEKKTSCVSEQFLFLLFSVCVNVNFKDLSTAECFVFLRSLDLLLYI